MVAVAIGGAAVVGAGATIIAGNKAAKAQSKHERRDRRSAGPERPDPRRLCAVAHGGRQALGALTNAYGLNGSTSPGPVGTEQGQPMFGAYGGFFTSPGYQFRRDEGIEGDRPWRCRKGALTGGATIKAEQRYGDGLAASEYDAYTSRLAQLAGLGQSATAGTAAAGSSAAGNISTALINSGNARASSYTNTASAINSGLNNVMSAYLMQGMMKPGGGGSDRGKGI
jgi:hypothetical protein